MLFIILFVSIATVECQFINMICPTEWSYGINFYESYDSPDFPILNEPWSNTSSILNDASTNILAGELFNKCLKNISNSLIEWCRHTISAIYKTRLSVPLSINLLSKVVCYHLCLSIIASIETGLNCNNCLKVCPSPCHQKNICTRDIAAVECLQTHTVIFSHDFECSCKAKFYWDNNRQRCARLNPCETEKYYPCYRPGTAWCVYDQKEFTHECQCNINYVGYSCQKRYDPCKHVSHKQHIITVNYPGDRVCNINNGNQCVNQVYTYKCLCSRLWISDSRYPFDNCLMQVQKCQSMICVKGICLSSPSGKKGFCKCDKDYGGENCNVFIGTWTEWSRWDRCRPSCGNNRWTVRTRTCTTDPTSIRKDCDGSVTEWDKCSNRRCSHEVENLLVKVFEIRYVLFLGSILANLTVGLIIVMVWRVLFCGIIKHQLTLFFFIVADYFSQTKNT